MWFPSAHKNDCFGILRRMGLSTQPQRYGTDARQTDSYVGLIALEGIYGLKKSV